MRPRATASDGLGDVLASDQLRDVVVVGAGQKGLSIAWGLRRDGVDSLLVIDRNPAGLEGPWATFARMPTLRTPKGPTGVDGGVPELTVAAWYERTYGHDAWESLALIPTDHWMDYLRWFRGAVGIDVANGVVLQEIRPDPDGGGLILDCRREGTRYRVRTRKLVLATGYDGAGGPALPDFVADLPAALWAHSSSMIDFQALRGKRVGVIGIGASAFDNAATAAEAGAAEVHQFGRRPELPNVNVVRWMDFSGFCRNYYALPDHLKRSYVRQFLGRPMPPPPETLRRMQRLERHRLHLGASPLDVSSDGKAVRIACPGVTAQVDFLILGTGYAVALDRMPELRHVVPHVLVWGDRRTGRETDDALDAKIDRYPYLGPAYELQERVPGSAPWLGRIHVANNSAVVSMGPLGGNGINGMKFSTPRLVRGVLRDLALDAPTGVAESA